MIDQWIETKADLKKLAELLGVRDDWHEPDEQGVSCELMQDRLDNAFGDESEAHIILTHTNPSYTIDGEVRYAINVANLLAWACK